MTRCHICERPVEHDHDPCYVETDPGHYDDELELRVAMGNGLYVDACWSCRRKWPDRHKLSGRIEEYADVTPLDWAERLVASASPRTGPISAGAAAALENARIAVELLWETAP